MKVLALDPGTKSCGVFDGITSETWDFKGSRPERLAQFYRRFVNCLYAGRYYAVVYEFAFVRGPDATRCGFGIDGIIEAVATDLGCAVLDVNNNSLKAWARVYGAAIPTKGKKGQRSAEGKIAMMEFVKSKFGGVPSGPDEADVIALWHYFQEHAKVTQPKEKRK